MYRSPEMVEPAGKVIGAASDVWMLGCVAYLLAYRKHPFQNEGKLAILTCSPPYPEAGTLAELVQSMLQADPLSRPSARTLTAQLTEALGAQK
jgi:serine/threonine protein kinase